MTLAVPGFIEGHGHFVGLGQSMMTLDLTQAETCNDIMQLTRTSASNWSKLIVTGLPAPAWESDTTQAFACAYPIQYA